MFYIRGPVYIGVCDGLQLDAVVQYGTSGFTYGVSTFLWAAALAGAIRTPTTVINAASDASAFSSCPNDYVMCGTKKGISRFQISDADLPPGAYTITLTVTNMYGLATTQTKTVIKNATHSVPFVSYMGPNPEPAYRANGLTLNSIVVNLPLACRAHEFQLLSGISNRNDVLFEWDILYGDSKDDPLTLSATNPFVHAVRSNTAQSLSISPSVLQFAELNKNYTLLFVVSMFDISGLEIRHDLQKIKIMILESHPVAIILGGSRQVNRARVNYLDDTFYDSSQSIPEPFTLDGSQSTDPDNSRFLCYRWDCLEPTTCAFQATVEATSTIFDMFADATGQLPAASLAASLDSILKDGSSMSEYLSTVLFPLGITTHDVCRLSSAGTLPTNHFTGYELGNDGEGHIDLEICDAGLSMYSINTTRVRLQFTVAKSFKNSAGLYTCGQSGDFPLKFIPFIATTTVDLEIVVEDPAIKELRMASGWIDPVLQIQPLSSNTYSHATSLALRCSNEFFGAQYVWSVSRESKELIFQGHVVPPLVEGLAGGSDTCLLEIPPFSLLPMGREYVFTLTASLPGGIQSTAWITVITSNVPISGTLSVSPTTGEPYYTDFSFECLGWTVTSPEDLPLSYAFYLQYNSLEQYELGVSSRSAVLSPVQLPRGGIVGSGCTLVEIVAYVMDASGHLTITNSTSGPIYMYSNRSKIVAFFQTGIYDWLASQLITQNWENFMEYLTFAVLEMNEQIRFENYLVSAYPVLGSYDDISKAEYFIGTKLPPGVSQNISYVARRRARALLSAGFSLATGVQVSLINQLINYYSNILIMPSSSVLRKMADALRASTIQTTDPTPLQHRNLLQLVMSIVQRVKEGDVPPLPTIAMQSLFAAVANIHAMIFLQQQTYNDPFTPFSARLQLVDFALINIAAEGAASTCALDGMPISFESGNVSLAGFKISARLRAVLRTPWTVPTQVEMVSIKKKDAVEVKQGNGTSIAVNSRIVLQSYTSQQYIQWRPSQLANILSNVLELRIVDGDWSTRQSTYETYATFQILLNSNANLTSLGIPSAAVRRAQSRRTLQSASRQVGCVTVFERRMIAHAFLQIEFHRNIVLRHN